jgi:hypothetical protein
MGILLGVCLRGRYSIWLLWCRLLDIPHRNHRVLRICDMRVYSPCMWREIMFLRFFLIFLVWTWGAPILCFLCVSDTICRFG